MNYNIGFVQNPIVDILIAVAEKGGVENCINMVGRFLVQKNIKVRVIQLVYEGYSWADECMEFHYIYQSRNNNTVGGFVEGYKRKLLEIGTPHLVLATAWPMMSHVAKTVGALLDADFLVASWLHAPLSRYEQAGYGGKEMLDAADFHLAISDFIASDIKSISDSKVYRTYNPVDLSRTKRVEHSSKNMLLFVGRISAEKNLSFVLRAMAKAKDEWRLRLVGDGDERENLEKLVKELKIADRVEFVGWSENPWQYADGCFALIMSSFYEGFPLVAIESLSCGLPVIANGASGADEIVEDGVNGYVYRDNDIKSLVDLLDKLYCEKDNPEMSERCIASVTNYSYERALFDFYLKVYAAINGRIITDRLFERQGSQQVEDKISVIIPCYNAEKYVGRCFESIAMQSIGIDHLEVIIINDCSTDNTLNLLMKYEEEYPENICVINCSENGGQGKARNIGLEYATGSYITFIDADDCIDKDMLLVLYCLAVCYPVDMIKCDFSMFSNYNEIAPAQSPDGFKITLIDDTKERKEFFLDNAFICAPWAKLINRNIFRNENIRFPEGVRMEDLLFTYRLVSRSTSYISIPFKGYNYYQNNSGIMKSQNLKNYYMDVFFMFKKAFEEYRENGFYNDIGEELSFVFYKKVFIDLIKYISHTFRDIPVENIQILTQYAMEWFPDYKGNRYLSAEDKAMISDLLSDQ